MQITRKSIVSGKSRTIDLPITADQVTAYKAGALVQDAFPQLSADQREFFITGITQEEWDATFGDDEDDGTPPSEECERDLTAYCKALTANNIHACVAIEKKYGCYGMSPQMVTEELARLAAS